MRPQNVEQETHMRRNGGCLRILEETREKAFHQREKEETKYFSHGNPWHWKVNVVRIFEKLHRKCQCHKRVMTVVMKCHSSIVMTS